MFGNLSKEALPRHERIFIAPDTEWDQTGISAEMERLGSKLGVDEVAALLGFQNKS